MRHFNAAQRGQPGRTTKLTREQELQLRTARAEHRFALGVVQVIEWLETNFPDQVRDGAASVTASQWIDADAAIHEREVLSRETRLRGYERWKTSARAAGLEADHAAVEVVDARSAVVPTFNVDVAAATELHERTAQRLRELESSVGVPSRREFDQEEIADELDVSSGTIQDWIERGLPYTVEARPGGGLRRAFDLEEVKTWVEERLGPLSRTISTKSLSDLLGVSVYSVRDWIDQGLPSSRRTFGVNATRYVSLDEAQEYLVSRGGHGAMALARCLEPNELRRMFSSSNFTETARKLGISIASLRNLRRELGVSPPGERVPAWQIVTRKDLEEALAKHQGRRDPIAEDLGLSRYELRKAFEFHGLLDHPLVLRPVMKWPYPFTKEELVAAIESLAGYREKVAKALGVSRSRLREAIIDFDLVEHPLLQAGKIPAKISKSIAARRTGPGARSRGHEHEFGREETLVPFWLAAIREVMARHPGRGGGRASAVEIGVSPVSLTNLIQGKRVPGYDVMLQIMAAAGHEPPDWRQALAEVLERYQMPVERARGLKYSKVSLDGASSLLGLAPQSVVGLLAGNSNPSMVTLQRLLEATGRPYLVESITTPETVAYGGRQEPEKAARWRRAKASEILRLYKSGLTWAQAREEAGVSEAVVVKWAKEARQGFGPFAEAAADEPDFLPLPRHLREGAPQPRSGEKFGTWDEP